ncbi:MAG: tetratricopeptide repeat protein [Chloroflexi bacterium]|nr:tetratricopeptide repeat protein [Chloroflexota bacterium]MCI0577110.1 tetratricopeptide repeat protein [Chloroflexota bacterium]MCI0646847.1 tetratricopeptide repeat protein [Chloroflexota bacterium]MCI0726954.1 tetratricopeptide repeat protein [Chloroflexota bacterium]
MNQDNAPTPEAIARAADDVRANPGHVEGWVTLGHLLSRAGDEEKARLCFERALELAPDHLGARVGLARFDQPGPLVTPPPNEQAPAAPTPARRSLRPRRPISGLAANERFLAVAGLLGAALILATLAILFFTNRDDSFTAHKAEAIVTLYNLPGHDNIVTSVVFTPDGLTLASGAVGGTVRLWSVAGGSVEKTFTNDSDVITLAFSPDGQILAAGLYNGVVNLWHVGSGALLRPLESSRGRVYGVAFSPDGTILASAGEDGFIRLWQMADGVLLRQFRSPDSSQAQGVVFAPDGQTLASLSATKNIWLWRVGDGTALRSLETGDLMSRAVFSPGGTMLAAAEVLGGKISLWRVSDGRLLRTIEEAPLVYDMLFSPNGEILMSVGSDNAVRFWQVDDGELLKTLQGSPELANSAALTRDGLFVGSGTINGVIRIWQLR